MHENATSFNMIWRTYPDTKTRDQLKPQAKCLIRLFVYFYALFGIRLEWEPNPTEVPVSLIAKRRNWRAFYIGTRCLAAVAYVVFVGGTTFSVAKNVRGKPSLLDFVRFIYYATSFIIILCGGVSMCWHASSLSSIIFTPDQFSVRFYPTHFFCPLFLSLPSFIYDIQGVVQSFLNDPHLIQKLAHLSGLYLWAIQYATICMYTECEAVIRGQLRDITQAVMGLSPTEDLVIRLTRSKNSVRSSIRKLNSIFGNILLVFYMKIFTLVTLRFGAVILWGTSERFSEFSAAINLLTAGLQIGQVFETTRLGSLIISEAQRAEGVLYAPRKRSRLSAEVVQRYVLELRRVLEYRENIDALTISDCFINCKATMFNYLGTMFTCIAIVLQFDFDVLKVLEGAKQSAVP